MWSCMLVQYGGQEEETPAGNAREAAQLQKNADGFHKAAKILPKGQWNYISVDQKRTWQRDPTALDGKSYTLA